MPRVISGSAGGLKLKAPTGLKTRPSSDRSKEAMFSALTARLVFTDLHILDLYSGSGQLGIEALSRGATKAVFVERDRSTAVVVKANVEHCGFQDQAQLMTGDALKTAKILAEQGESFDLIFMDPPYAEAWTEFGKIEKLVLTSEILKKTGYLIFESDAKAPKQGKAERLVLEKSCQYGSAMVSFYRHPDATMHE